MHFRFFFLKYTSEHLSANFKTSIVKILTPKMRPPGDAATAVSSFCNRLYHIISAVFPLRNYGTDYYSHLFLFIHLNLLKKLQGIVPSKIGKYRYRTVSIVIVFENVDWTTENESSSFGGLFSDFKHFFLMSITPNHGCRAQKTNASSCYVLILCIQLLRVMAG